MKKTIVASIIGVVATVAAVQSSYGQGQVFFNNYGATTDAIITWQPGDSGGTGPATGFTATLWYQFGGGALTALGNSTAFNAALPGYFTGPIVTIPGYAGGSITFQIQAYDGTSYDLSTHRGQSALFTLNSIAQPGLQQPAGEFGPALVPFTVATVPEPSTLALIGLGTGALLFLRRRK
jgi:hypothetical protein